MTETIRIGFFPLEKDAQTCFEHPNCKRPGGEVEVLQMIFRLMKIDFTVIDVWKEFGRQYDFGSKQQNGSWSGVIGLLVQNKLDMVGLSMRMLLEREEAVIFSYPTRYFESVFIIASPSTKCPRQFIFNAFSQTVWNFIVLSVIFLYLIRTFMTYFLFKYILKMKEMFRFWIKLVSMSFSIMTTSTRVLYIFTLFSSFFLMQSYQTDMYAFLSNPLQYYVPFRSIKEALSLVKQKKMFFVTLGSQRMMCTPITCQRFEEATKNNPIRKGQTTEEVELLIRNGGIYQSTVDSALLPGQLSWLTQKPREFLIIRDEDAPSYYVAYAFSKRHKKLIRKFNQALIEVLPAVSTITTGHGYATMKTSLELLSKNNPRKPLSIGDHLWQLFRSLIIALSVCILVFLFELIFKYLKNISSSRTFTLSHKI